MAQGYIQLPSIAAQTNGTVRLPDSIFTQVSNYELVLTVSLQLAAAETHASKGYEVAWHQQQVTAAKALTLTATPSCLCSVISNKNRTLIIATKASVFQFSKATGLLELWTKSSGEPIITSLRHKHGITTGFWRPPTDNDHAKANAKWKSSGVHKITSQLRSMELNSEPSGVLTLVVKT